MAIQIRSLRASGATCGTRHRIVGWRSTLPAAQQFPSRPVKIFVTIPPGGAPDIAARLLAQRLIETIGQPVVVENRPGANGNLAGDTVAKSPSPTATP